MSAEERLKALADNGWTLHFYFSYDGWNFSGATAGDCNCPHANEYDADGHGYSELTENDISFDGIPNWTPLEWWLDKLETHIAAIVPGAPWPPRPKPQKPTRPKRRWWLPW